MDLIPSVVFQNHRMRAIWSRIYPRPLRETFHEFLINVVLWTMSEDWWKHQIALAEAERHVVVRWKYAFEEYKRASMANADREQVGDIIVYSSEPTGPVASLLQLGYDLYCLQARNKLPEFFIERMRRRKDFQGARYEVAASAVMMRAGFDVEYLDEGEINERHCEFIATHRGTGVRVGVEAKSRIRPGVLNTPGEFEYEEDFRGIQNLIRKAKKQRPEGLPFFIFVDVNLPPTPTVAWPDKPWLRDLRRVVNADGESTQENPDPYTALFPTNYAQYYSGNNEPAPPPEWGMVLPKYAIVPLPERDLIVRAVTDSLGRYGRIPREI